MYKVNLALNKLQRLMRHKIKQNKTKSSLLNTAFDIMYTC